MSRQKKVIRNVIISALLFTLFLMRSGLYLSPLSAHESSELRFHYGPSEVIHIKDLDGDKYFLCKYDRWVSCHTVTRKWVFFWMPNFPIGFENDIKKAVGYSWDSKDLNNRAYGIINDDKIKRIEITLADGSTLTQRDFYDNMFLFTWQSNNFGFKNIRGYDYNNNILFDEIAVGY